MLKNAIADTNYYEIWAFSYFSKEFKEDLTQNVVLITICLYFKERNIAGFQFSYNDIISALNLGFDKENICRGW